MGNPHPHRELIKAWADDTSTEIEYKTASGAWSKATDPKWSTDKEYRIKPRADFEEWFRGRLSPTYCETWQSAQQAERERIRDIVKAVGVQGNHNEWFDCCHTIMERIDATE